jgi:XTP/dITP diphosphohydrolase
MKLVFASNNAHKLEEVRKIMPAGVEVVSLHEIGFEQEIEETGETLEENSLIKAETVWKWVKGLEDERVSGLVDGVFADDTGLEITALGGQPGVYSARWAGSPEANRQKAIRELAGKEDRSARFRTVITLLMNDDAPLNGGMMQVEGEVRGWITEEEHGAGGFGYDPIFIPEGYDKTFGELPAEVKNSISHRARALQALVKILSSEH